jgi:eukaryotic-like serine/threonine-protein kinase
MPEPSWSRVKEVFQAALERAPADRASFVQQACGDDLALHREVESLLSSLREAGSFAEHPAIEGLPGSDAPGTSSVLALPGRALEAGDSLGPYQIVELLGAGGMGEVYRARDAKLNRDVALKIVPEVFATNPDRLSRFRREAQVLASLNHQNIGHIYGLEDSGARHALVLELVEGPTLEDVIALHGRRMTSGLEATDTLRIALQIADALEAAHEQGVIHRDLKPANVKVRPDGVVKVLDFGLARALDSAPASPAEAMDSPTMTGAGQMTGPGMILGTAPYMSPEQARGKLVDKRGDIWAFGCVLFEMLTGRRPFAGETTSDTIAGILTRDPDWNLLPASTPARVRALLQRCLEKDPKRRLRDIGDARIEIEHVLGESSAPAAATRPRTAARWALWAAGLPLLLAGGWTLASVWRTGPVGPLQYTQLTDFADTATAPSLSPDGRWVTFIRGGAFFQNPRQVGQIYVKLLPNGDAVRLTDDPRPKFSPVFTPDGSRVAYSMIDAGSWDTWTVPITGGPSTRMLPNASGLNWMPDGRVLFSEIKSGTAMHMGIVTATELRAESRSIYFPEHERMMAHYSYASPDRKSILIVEMGPGGGFTEPCRLIPFDGSSAGRRVGPKGRCRSAAWSPDGRWMYFWAIVDERSHLWRQAFPNGTPEQITFDPTQEEGVAVAPDGKSLVTSVGEERSAIWLHDEAGDHEITTEGSARLPVMARDQRSVFYLQAGDLVKADLASRKSVNVLPGWSVGFGYDVSADGTEVVFVGRQDNGPSAIWLASLDRRFAPRRIASAGDQVSFGPGGALIIRQREENANYLDRLDRNGGGRERIIATPILNKSVVSPDGEWVIVNRAQTDAPQSPEITGRQPETVAVPTRGGSPKRICAFNCLPYTTWSPDGRFLFVGDTGRTAVLPIPPGQPLPDLPAAGIGSPAELHAIAGARTIERVGVLPGLSLSTYVFLKSELRRNLFRIHLR